MVYFLFWLSAIITLTHFVSTLYQVSAKLKVKSFVISGIIGATLRFLTISWLLILVYPVLQFV